MAGQSSKQHPDYAGVAAAAPGEIIEPLRRIVSRGAARWRRLALLRLAGAGVASLLAYLWLVFLLDNAVHLPGWARFLAGGAFLAAVVWSGWRLARSWRRLRLTHEEAALAIERSTSGCVQNRLINSIQLVRDVSPEVGQALVRENCLALQQIRLQPPTRMRPALLCAGVAVLAVAIGIVFWGVRPELFTNAASRILIPFSKVAPVYRTTLSVQPGDARALRGEDVTISVQVRGAVPRQLKILRAGVGQYAVLTLKPGQRKASYTFRNLDATTSYAVRGGDFTSPWFRIEVPVMAQLGMVKTTFRYPAYTRCPPQLVESTNGNLEALRGTRAECVFVLDNPADDAALLLERPAPGDAKPAKDAPAPERLALKKLGPRAFSCEIIFENLTGYQLETRRRDAPTYRSSTYQVRVTADQPPQLALTSVNDQDEVAVDAVLPVGVSAKDDYGLQKVGLFQRPAGAAAAPKPAEGTPPEGTPPAAESEPEWQPMKVWDVPGQEKTFQGDYALQAVSLGAAEGDQLELAPRGIDTDPLKANAWTTGGTRRILVGGEGAALQVLYEQILATEAAIKQLVDAQQQAGNQAAAWIQKLDPASGLNWADKAQADALANAMAEQAAQQERLHQQAATVAREMAKLARTSPAAATLRISLGMLADTEMVQGVRILEAVPKRETPQDRRAALGDAQLAQQRTVRSLQEIRDEYVTFRRDWELVNMMSFLKMLADRQSKMSAESAGLPADLLKRSMLRRQQKVVQLTGMVQTAFAGMSQRAEAAGKVMADAFGEAATAFDSTNVKQHMQQAAANLEASRGIDASASQKLAAAALNEIHAKLKAAQAEAARQLMAMLKQQLEEQKKLQALRPGDAKAILKINEDELNLTDVVRLQKMTDENKKRASAGHNTSKRPFEDDLLKMLNPPDSGTRQNLDVVSLSKNPIPYESFPEFSDRAPNPVTPPIQQDFKDLVGDLIDEIEEMMDNYDTYNLNAAFNLNDPGDVAKMAGPLASTAASAFTGNQKAPPHDFGGASRMGRQGARAHGLAVGDLSINRKGREEALDSQERIPDQAGVAKEIKSGDPQNDFATGVGGKKVASDDPSFFNTKNAGQWTNDIAQRMEKPKALHLMVERQGGPPIDPRVAEMLRALDSNQQQVIQRINALKKKLNNLYLPSDQLDEISRQLGANLERLKERPDAEVFRQQQETLARLRSVATSIGNAASDFQPSVPREQVIRGSVLDEPPLPAMPQYEEAVKRYFEKLSGL